MQISELKEFSAEELRNRVETMRRENYNLRFKGIVESIEDNSIFKKNRKEIARIKTILGEAAKQGEGK